MTAPLDLDALSAALAKATPGEWVVADQTVIGSTYLPDNVEELSAWYDWTQKDGPDLHFVAETASHTIEGEHNAAAIAAVMSAAPQMIAEITALREKVGVLIEALVEATVICAKHSPGGLANLAALNPEGAAS